MPQYQRKRTVTEAEQYAADHFPFADEAKYQAREGGGHEVWHEKAGIWAPIFYGDWIIRELDGDGFYKCDPVVFEKTYEAA